METLDETATVISASKVTGTQVYNTSGDRLGEIYDVMIDKRSGKVGLTIEQLQGAPTFGANEMPAWGDRAYEARIHDYYKTAPYWGA